MQQIRQDMGLPQRVAGAMPLAEASEQLTAALEKELQKGYMGNYGREYLFRNLCAVGIPATQQRAYVSLKILDPRGVELR